MLADQNQPIDNFLAMNLDSDVSIVSLRNLEVLSTARIVSIEDEQTYDLLALVNSQIQKRCFCLLKRLFSELKISLEEPQNYDGRFFVNVVDFSSG